MKRIITLLFCLSLLTTVAFAESIQDGSSGAIMKPHNELDGLNDGDYQHLTVAEKDVAINGSDTLDFTAKTVTAIDSVTVGTPELTISGDGLGNVTAAAASITVNADVEFTGNVTGLPAVITVHNSLSGLNDGDYQHLTQAELLELQGLDTNYVATSSLVTTLLNYAALNGDSNEDFAADHLSADTASFTSNIDIGGELSVGAATDMTIIGDGSGNVTIDTVATLTFTADSDFNGVVDLTDATVIGLPSGVSVHNDLTGLNDGEYQHLTVVEKDQALNGSDILDFTVNTVDFTDPATTRTNLGLGTMAVETATDYVTTSTLATTLLDYVTTTDLSTALSDYVTSSGLTTILDDYVQATALGDMAYENTTDYVATSAYAADMTDKMDTDGANAIGIEFFTPAEKSVAINGSNTLDFTAEDITATTVTVSDGIDIGSTPDVSVFGDGAGKLTLDATTTDITGDIEMSGNGAITNINNFGVTNYVVVNSSNKVTSGSLRAGLIYSLGSNLSVGTIPSLKGIEMWFGSVGGGSSVISNAQGLILKPIAMGATTVTSMTALDIVPYSGGNQYTTAYGLRSQLATVVGKTTYNLYIDGTAPNYIKGDTTVDGDLILTPKAAASADVEGAIRYDSDDNHFYGYNGTSWVQLDN